MEVVMKFVKWEDNGGVFLIMRFYKNSKAYNRKDFSMVQSVGFYQFANAFEQAGRGGQFSYSGLQALYNFLEESDPDYDLDVIELCCEYTEYGDLEELQQDYPDIEDMRDLDIITTVVSESPLIIQNF